MTHFNTLIKFLVFLLVLSPTLLTPAFAHSHLVKSDPVADSKMSESPKAVTLTLSEAVESKFSKIEVTHVETKTRVDEGKVTPAVGKNSVTVQLKTPLQSGKYHVEWKATSKDTHKSHGSFDFTLASPKE